MSLNEFNLDGAESVINRLSGVAAACSALDRGWKAVVLGLFLTTVVLFGVHIPW